MVHEFRGESWDSQNAIIEMKGFQEAKQQFSYAKQNILDDSSCFCLEEEMNKQTKLKRSFTKLGDKKISLLLVLRALELMSDKNHPIRQIELSKMVNDVGGMLDVDVWCDRKTVGRHIKLLIASGYKIIYLQNKGYYLEQNSFTQSESDLLMQAIDESAMSDTDKQILKKKLEAQKKHLDKATLTDTLTAKE